MRKWASLSSLHFCFPLSRDFFSKAAFPFKIFHTSTLGDFFSEPENKNENILFFNPKVPSEVGNFLNLYSIETWIRLLYPQRRFKGPSIIDVNPQGEGGGFQKPQFYINKLVKSILFWQVLLKFSNVLWTALKIALIWQQSAKRTTFPWKPIFLLVQWEKLFDSESLEIPWWWFHDVCQTVCRDVGSILNVGRQTVNKGGINRLNPILDP